MKVYFQLLFLVMVLWGCSEGDRSTISHPTPKNIPTVDKDYELNLSSKGSGLVKPMGSKGLPNVDSLQLINQIGSPHDESGKIFGYIRDVITDHRNRMFALDDQEQHIKVYGTQGEYLATLSNKGKGPGELQWAESMANYKDSLLLVNNGLRIEIFDINGDEIRYVESQKINKRSKSICTIGDTLFVHHKGLLKQAEESSKSTIPIIQAYSLPELKPLYSFGKSYQSSSPMVVDRLSLGQISCNEFSNTVIFAFDRLPVLHGYSASSGQLKWKNRIGDASMGDIVQERKRGQPSLTYKPAENNVMDRILPIISLREEYQLMQVQRTKREPGSFDPHRDVITLLVNSTDGTGETVSQRLPAVVEVTPRRVITVSDDFTSLLLYELRK